ncbi:hypothetical protein KO516_01320 [Citreicella sp. C3M06]|uniref:hypothetical protein n=1 Tax=Citreicella sp. C3M06 TaxID=2841564 RepID=UPI001C097AFB|nr:hypothetical protein [Citreicella sp. C3M06]MBU2959482.1 hypothetical protein [Citreicella sp. C3M06]
MLTTVRAIDLGFAGTDARPDRACLDIECGGAGDELLEAHRLEGSNAVVSVNSSTMTLQGMLANALGADVFAYLGNPLGERGALSVPIDPVTVAPLREYRNPVLLTHVKTMNGAVWRPAGHRV